MEGPCPVKTRVTGYVAGNVGYKLLLPANRNARANAWKFGVYKGVMEREVFHRTVQIIESDRIGLYGLFRGDMPKLGTESLHFWGPAEPCEEWQGPPPDECDYFEIDWSLRRSSLEWCLAQYEAVAFGPQRVKRCVMGALKSHADIFELGDTLQVSPDNLTNWLMAGTPFIEDRYANQNPEAWDARHTSRNALTARAVLQLAQYESHWTPHRYWTPDEASAYLKIIGAPPL